MKLLPLLSFIFVFAASVYAKKTMVTTASEINTGFWFAGDTIVMKNGIWTNQSIAFRADGTETEPVVLIAETAGEVILNGSSKLAFSGKYIVISGLYFKDGTLSGSAIISFRNSSSSLAENCRVTNTAIENYNPANKTVDSKWVSLYGKNNRVDHCSFENKTNSGTLLVVWLTSGTVPNHVIDQNYFGLRNANVDASGNELNGQEIIRIGDSSTSMQNAGVVVSNNIFEHCNGEIEIISNKSCENLYTNNIFLECKGMLTLRHGNRCTVDGNYFFGNGISNSGGVRIIGEDHKVYNNYFYNLQGTGYRAALCIVRGKENSALNEYFQVKNAKVAFNTMVDCKQSFNINYNSSSSLNQPPIGTTIDHNHVYNTTSANTNVNIEQVNVAAMDVTWKNNLMNQGRYTNFAYTETEIITGKNPMMVLRETTIPMYEPDTNSELAGYMTDEYSNVTVDIRGRNRGSQKIPGASQITGTVEMAMPQKADTGADFWLSATTKTESVYTPVFFNAYVSNGSLITKVATPGTLRVYDTLGRCLFQQNITEGSNTSELKHNGIYLLRFQPFRGGVATKKVVYE